MYLINMNKDWIVKRLKNVKFKEPLLIEGLPGMGNVGKITVDFIIESLKAIKVYEIYSYKFPNFVFVNEKGITELPKVEIYYKKVKGKDLFLVAGDVQPVDESSCYDFCDNLLNLFQEFKGKEVITLGGIGLEDLPKSPKVYCSGTDNAMLKKFTTNGVKNAEGVVGPIIGVSGLLVGLAQSRGLKGAVLLVETLGLPAYLGIKESKELLTVLNKHYKLGLDINKLNKEVKLIEKEISERLEKVGTMYDDRRRKVKKEITNYIG